MKRTALHFHCSTPSPPSFPVSRFNPASLKTIPTFSSIFPSSAPRHGCQPGRKKTMPHHKQCIAFMVSAAVKFPGPFRTNRISGRQARQSVSAQSCNSPRPVSPPFLPVPACNPIPRRGNRRNRKNSPSSNFSHHGSTVRFHERHSANTQHA